MLRHARLPLPSYEQVLINLWRFSLSWALQAVKKYFITEITGVNWQKGFWLWMFFSLWLKNVFYFSVLLTIQTLNCSHLTILMSQASCNFSSACPLTPKVRHLPIITTDIVINCEPLWRNCPFICMRFFWKRTHKLVLRINCAIIHKNLQMKTLKHGHSWFSFSLKQLTFDWIVRFIRSQ